MKQKSIVLLVIITMFSILSACALEDDIDSNSDKNVSPVKGKKIAYIVNIEESELFTLCATQCEKTAEKLGMTCDVFFSGGDDENWEDAILRYAEQGYDGLILSHGGSSYSYDFLTGLLNEYKDLKIVTFDTQFVDSKGDQMKIDGVTQVFQDDAGFSKILCNYICDKLCADKPEGVPANVLKVWEGPGYLAPFDRREEGYVEYENLGKIRTVETVGPDDTNADPEQSTYEAVKRQLALYKEDEIDAIWVCYDAYARGAYRALEESGKNIPLVTVDICNTDIQEMLEDNSLWKACACTDFPSNGEECVRILALELNDEYSSIFSPTTDEASDYIEMPGSLITQDMLTSTTTLENLYDVAPKSYGDHGFLSTSNWIRRFIGY